ncbi:cyclopropane-fatty-acyl-phospholipid synthase family protein [Candidatus Pseudothioglobus singularis]|nr:cyclopropane-fatty-acyl-phospholipid synthase family protein [Candidatus Pseudothioglobus singularis]
MITLLILLAEKGLLPDAIIRIGIKRLCRQRLVEASSSNQTIMEQEHSAWIDVLKESPIALVPEKANEQHYEVPPRLFELVLGDRLKYSSGLWPEGVSSLDESEVAMLKLTIQRAGLVDGQDVLELGCGWGSLTLYMAECFPKSKITAVSNSNDQRQFIEERCEERNLKNVEIITADMNDFETAKLFDRVVSIEMFEHMRNYEKLLGRVNVWLRNKGKLFVHIFSHQKIAYPFEDNDDADWMAREFFSGGQMPSHRLLMSFPGQMKIEKDWRVSGTHYEKTSLAWLQKMDKNKAEVLELFKKTYGESDANSWFQRWRIFFMSCEVLFGFNRGSEWGVSHYLFEKPQ